MAILGLTPRRKHLVVARAGAPLFAYGLVSASLAARARDGDAEAMAHCPLPAGMLEEFEEASDAFDRELAARSDGTGGYDLSGIADALCFVGGGEEGKGVPNAATAAPPLDSFAFVGSMRQARAGLLGKPLPLSSSSAKGGGDANAKKVANKKLKQDVMVQVPALALSRLVRRIQVAAAVRLWSWSFLFWKVFSSFADDEERKTRKKNSLLSSFFRIPLPTLFQKNQFNNQAEAKMDAAALAEAGKKAAAAADASAAAMEEEEAGEKEEATPAEVATAGGGKENTAGAPTAQA